LLSTKTLKDKPSCEPLSALLAVTVYSCKKCAGPESYAMKQLRTPGLMAVALFLLLALPILSGDSTIESLAIQALLLSSAAVAWNLFSGYTGYISLGQATYYGLGAYFFALVSQDLRISGSWGLCLLLPCAGLIASVFAVPLGWVMLRARRATFMVITIAIFFVFQQLAYNLRDITGGSEGIYMPIPDWSSDLPFYLVASTVLLLATFVSWGVRRSKFGLTLLAIRDDEDRARGLGVRTGLYKLGAYVLSAGFTGVIGALSIFVLGLINPTVAFDPSINLIVAVVCFFGGIGTVMGPVVGSLLLGPLQAYLQQQIGAGATGLDQMLLGGLLLAILLVMPEGIVPFGRKVWGQVSTALGSVSQVPARQTRSHSHRTLSMEPSLQQQHPALGSVLETHVPDIHEPPFSENSWDLLALSDQQPLLLPAALSVSHRIKGQRLVPLPSPVPFTQHVSTSGTSIVSWRCPSCRKPFLLKGDTCYCPRCGFTRSLVREEQHFSG
jgi:branched-chain amino acid transport system permease protein